VTSCAARGMTHTDIRSALKMVPTDCVQTESLARDLRAPGAPELLRRLSGGFEGRCSVFRRSSRRSSRFRTSCRRPAAASIAEAAGLLIRELANGHPIMVARRSSTYPMSLPPTLLKSLATASSRCLSGFAKHALDRVCSETTTRDVDRHGISPEKSSVDLRTLNITAAALTGSSAHMDSGNSCRSQASDVDLNSTAAARITRCSAVGRARRSATVLSGSRRAPGCNGFHAAGVLRRRGSRLRARALCLDDPQDRSRGGERLGAHLHHPRRQGRQVPGSSTTRPKFEESL